MEWAVVHLIPAGNGAVSPVARLFVTEAPDDEGEVRRALVRARLAPPVGTVLVRRPDWPEAVVAAWHRRSARVHSWEHVLDAGRQVTKLTLRLPTELDQEYRAISEATGVPMAELIRQALAAYLPRLYEERGVPRAKAQDGP